VREGTPDVLAKIGETKWLDLDHLYGLIVALASWRGVDPRPFLLKSLKQVGWGLDMDLDPFFYVACEAMERFPGFGR
jgi:hypothetical protein